MTNSEDRITFTVSETAAALGVSEQTIRRWAKAGELPVVRIGSRCLVTAQWLADKLLLARGDADAIREKADDDAAEAESRRLSHSAWETEADYQARLTKTELRERQAVIAAGEKVNAARNQNATVFAS